jgi:hypothetical protein
MACFSSVLVLHGGLVYSRDAWNLGLVSVVACFSSVLHRGLVYIRDAWNLTTAVPSGLVSVLVSEALS